MDTEKQKKALEEIVGEILEKMGISANILLTTNAFSDENGILVEIQSEDSSYLIGKFGINLSALQHICRIIIKKKLDEDVRFSIDINGYREKQSQNIKDIANSAINETLEKNKTIELKPMNGYERRLVHIQVSENDLVESESVGEGEERRVAISPKK